MPRQKMIILCGPSGSGKTTLAQHILNKMPNLSFSISATTRPKRDGETHGKDYYFLSLDDFKSKLEKQEFVEHEEVYSGIFYGTLKSELQRIWDEKRIPVLDIDVIGALNIKKNFAPNALALFIHPVNLDNIKNRLKKRATESVESYEKRIHRAEEELNMAPQLDQIIYNDELEIASAEAKKIVEDYLAKENSVVL
ncbi:MAG: guanylate kinase [Sphingobacteriales bacterium]|nr:MAG: guanylate kinase [Sphingobacteriales bacterium]